MTSRVVAREAPTRDRQFHPPETSSTAPLTQRASSEARNAATEAISSGRPTRPRGVLSMVTS